MPENTLEHLLPVQNEIGETPIWVSKEQALYWIDYEQSKVYRLCFTTKSLPMIMMLQPELCTIGVFGCMCLNTQAYPTG